MKIRNSLALILAVILFTPIWHMPAVAAEENMIQNGNFEAVETIGGVLRPQGAFTLADAPTAQLGSAYAHGTGTGLHIDASSAFVRSAVRTNNKDGYAKFTAGDTLLLSWFTRSNTETRYQVLCCANATEGSVIQTAGSWVDNPSNGMLYKPLTDGAWKKMDYLFVVPEECSYINIVFFTMQNETIGYADFDDFSLTYVDTSNYFVNGNLERYVYHDFYKKNVPEYATLDGVDAYYKNYTLSAAYAHAGNMGLRMSCENKTGIMRALTLTAEQSVAGFAENEKVSLSYWVRSNCKTSYKYAYYAKNALLGSEISSDVASTGNNWQEVTAVLTVPVGCTKIVLQVMNYCAETGNYADFDDFYLGDRSKAAEREAAIEKAAAEEAVKAEEQEQLRTVEPYEGASNCILNGDFEASNRMDGWNYYYDATHYSVTSDKVHGGKNALQIDSPSDKWPIAYQLVTDTLVPGATYYFSAYARVKGGSGVARCTFEYLDVPLAEFSSTALQKAGGKVIGSDYIAITVGTEWLHLSATVQVPMNCHSIVVNLRNFTYNTSMYYDDIEFFMTAPPKLVQVSTDEVFYYADRAADGVATISLTEGNLIADAQTVSVALKDGETVLLEAENMPLSKDQPASFSYPLYILKEKGKTYHIEAVLHDAAGAVLDTQTQNVYKYDRPSFMREDGVIEIDDKVVDVNLALSCNSSEHYAKAAEMGLNTICVYGTHIDGVIAELEKYNLKAAIPLYFNMKPAGHPDNVEWVQSIVEKHKDSPAVLGWHTMDEPAMNLPASDYERLMEASYKAIRDVDPNHPIFIVDAADDLSNYEQQAKYCDVVMCDAYTAYIGPEAVGNYAIEHMDAAVAGAKGLKPVYYIAGTFERNGFFPSGNDHRNVMWQSFICGGMGFGIYPFINVYRQGGQGEQRDGTLPDSPLWNDLVEMANINEIDLAFKHFVHHDTQYLCGERNDTVWWEAWADGADVYVIILNRTMTEQPMSIPLTSHDGAVTIQSCTASLIAGDTPKTMKITDGVLQHTLTSNQAALYKLTPDTPVDFSAVQRVTFGDLDAYPWARDAIEVMRSKQILQEGPTNNYNPGKQITRGDFAMMLVRTLEPEAQEAPLFEDVSADAYYAKELMTGKAQGILNGIGDNRFDPQGAITRQDLMTIVSRALQLDTAENKTAAFSDADAVADYAGAHVNAMLAAGLIQGNADGTLNPRGNTTRAEAAVIMQRIMNMRG